MSDLLNQDRLDRIIGENELFQRNGLDPGGFSYEQIRRKLSVLALEKRFLIFLVLRLSPDDLTQDEIAAAIGTGEKKFGFHMSVLCREKILLFKRDQNGIARFRVNPAFASAVGSLFV
jgi:hypothetical protein